MLLFKKEHQKNIFTFLLNTYLFCFRDKNSESEEYKITHEIVSYFETELRNHNRNTKLLEWVVRDYFIRYPLAMNINEGYSLTALLFSYFKDKHIDNCVIID